MSSILTVTTFRPDGWLAEMAVKSSISNWSTAWMVKMWDYERIPIKEIIDMEMRKRYGNIQYAIDLQNIKQ